MAIPQTLKQPIKTNLGYSAPNATNLGSRISLIISNIIGFITIVAGLAFIFYAIIGAINWISSQGDAQKAQKASKMITNAVIGLIITVTSFSIISIISKIIGVKIFNPTELIKNLKFN